MDTRTLTNRRTRRTTITLEADVADYIEEKLTHNRKLREKNIINDLIRKGIKADEPKATKAFAVKPFKTKFAAGMTVERLEEMIREI